MKVKDDVTLYLIGQRKYLKLIKKRKKTYYTILFVEAWYSQEDADSGNVDHIDIPDIYTSDEFKLVATNLFNNFLVF